MAITALPTPPSRQDPTNFNDRADAFLGALPQFQTEANALQVNVNTSEANAVASAAAVLAATNIVKWVSGTTYANGAVVWSPINGLAYRRITTSGSGTTDPSADTTNYKQVNGTGDVGTSGDQTIAGVKTFSSTIIGNAASATLAAKASALASGGGDGTAIQLSWVGLGGQPTWIFGGEVPGNVNVYNPGNFNVNYANSAGSVNSISTSQVLNATSGASVGAVGSYALLGVPYGTYIGYGPGSTVAGSSLRYSGATSGFTQNGTPSGTWRCMGYVSYTSDGYGGYATAAPSLFLRIS